MTNLKDTEPRRCRPTFSSSLMVSVGVLALKLTDLHFIDAGVKINSQYYGKFLMKKYLPIIKEQNSAPAHRAKGRSICSSASHHNFIPPSLWSPNSPDSRPFDYKTWDVFSSGFTAGKSKMWTSGDSISLWNGNAWTSAWSTTQSNSGVNVLCGCEGQTFRTNIVMCQSDGIFSCVATFEVSFFWSNMTLMIWS